MRTLTLLLALLLPISLKAAPALDLTPVKRWIAKQENFRSVTADFTQTRALKALRSPLSSPGKLWFVAPESFRWELGDPVKTIVLRKADTIWVITPGKKRAERYAAKGDSKQPGIQNMAAMDLRLAKDFADFQRKFEPLAISVEEARCRLEVAPRDPQQRKFLSAIKIDFETTSGEMLAFEVVTRDGSSLRNDFSNVRVNPKIDRRVFEFDLTGYEVVDGK